MVFFNQVNFEEFKNGFIQVLSESVDGLNSEEDEETDEVSEEDMEDGHQDDLDLESQGEDTDQMSPVRQTHVLWLCLLYTKSLVSILPQHLYHWWLAIGALSRLPLSMS